MSVVDIVQILQAGRDGEQPGAARTAYRKRYREASPRAGGAWYETIGGLLDHRSAAALHRERYSRETQREAIGRHDRHILAFRAEQKLSAQSWSDLLVDRLRTVQSLKGRHVPRDVLNRLGFALK